jgi:predicted HTH domain antitoxin
MNTVSIEIPEGYTQSFGTTNEEIARNAKTELAIEMYREGKWSTGKAGKFCGMTRIAFMDLLRDRKVPMPYTMEMLEEDFAYARSRVG